MPSHGSYRQARLEPPHQRVRRLLQRMLGRPGAKRQRVYRVDVGGQQLKRIVFPDSEAARVVADDLAAVAETGVFPELVERQGCEVWVRFLDGASVTTLDQAGVAELARMYAVLYAHAPVLRRVDAHPWVRELEADLAFLAQAGVLDIATHDTLRARAEDWTPAEVWVGYDYEDPRPANLLRLDDGSMRFLDVESLGGDRLLGRGVAKACYRWLGEQRGAFLDALRAQSSCPPIFDTLPFAELVSLASWTARSVRWRKRKLVRPALFHALLERESGSV